MSCRDVQTFRIVWTSHFYLLCCAWCHKLRRHLLRLQRDLAQCGSLQGIAIRRWKRRRQKLAHLSMAWGSTQPHTHRLGCVVSWQSGLVGQGIGQQREWGKGTHRAEQGGWVDCRCESASTRALMYLSDCVGVCACVCERQRESLSVVCLLVQHCKIFRRLLHCFPFSLLFALVSLVPHEGHHRERGLWEKGYNWDWAIVPWVHSENLLSHVPC